MVVGDWVCMVCSFGVVVFLSVAACSVRTLSRRCPPDHHKAGRGRIVAAGSVVGDDTGKHRRAPSSSAELHVCALCPGCWDCQDQRWVTRC
jgi:hypothetical protein